MARITKAQVGRPVDWEGYDGKRYNGALLAVSRAGGHVWAKFWYYVPNVGEFQAVAPIGSDRLTVL